jgi:hypothetical protein
MKETVIRALSVMYQNIRRHSADDINLHNYTWCAIFSGSQTQQQLL